MDTKLTSGPQFLTGSAGTGKSTTIRQWLADDPDFGVITASTGVASVNNGTKTIHSLLKFSTLDSLERKHRFGQLHRTIEKLYKGDELGRHIILDEVSMVNARTLDILHTAIDKVTGGEVSLVLTGDFCFAPDTRVLMADGTIKTAKEIQLGDALMGPDSKPRYVRRTCEGVDEMYKVWQTNGDAYSVNSKHLLVLRRGVDGCRLESWGRRFPTTSDACYMTAPELASRSGRFRACFVGYKAGEVTLPERAVDLNPYFLGLWLGDGDKDATRITTADPEIEAFCTSYAMSLGLAITKTKWESRTTAVRLHLSSSTTGGKNNNPILNALVKYGVRNNKHIPLEFLSNSADVRLQVLAGLLDSDGTWGGGRYSITLTRERLAKETKQLADGLGFRTSIRMLSNGYYKNGANGGAWIVAISGDTWRVPCKVARKVSVRRPLRRNRLTSVLRIEALGPGPYVGFELDGDSLFLLADGTVAHNCQLPPVEGEFAFKASCWPIYDANTTKLTKVWRQSDQPFLDALALIRGGNKAGARALVESGVEYSMWLDPHFDGVTLVSTNAEADAINFSRFLELPGEPVRFTSKTEGVPDDDWRLIPAYTDIKIGARVMVTANDAPAFTYANGDTGTVENITYTSSGHLPEVPLFVSVRLDRTGASTSIYFCVRRNLVSGRQLGTIRFMPLKLGYSLTIHKSQGLTFDRVQIDPRHWFAGSPALMYVALSRARTASGVKIIGPVDTMEKRIVAHSEVSRWL